MAAEINVAQISWLTPCRPVRLTEEHLPQEARNLGGIYFVYAPRSRNYVSAVWFTVLKWHKEPGVKYNKNSR